MKDQEWANLIQAVPAYVEQTLTDNTDIVDAWTKYFHDRKHDFRLRNLFMEQVGEVFEMDMEDTEDLISQYECSLEEEDYEFEDSEMKEQGFDPRAVQYYSCLVVGVGQKLQALSNIEVAAHKAADDYMKTEQFLAHKATEDKRFPYLQDVKQWTGDTLNLGEELIEEYSPYLYANPHVLTNNAVCFFRLMFNRVQDAVEGSTPAAA